MNSLTAQLFHCVRACVRDVLLLTFLWHKTNYAHFFNSDYLFGKWISMNRCDSDWPAEPNDVTKSHPIADENAVSVYDLAEVIVVEDEVTRPQSIGNWLIAACVISYVQSISTVSCHKVPGDIFRIFFFYWSWHKKCNQAYKPPEKFSPANCTSNWCFDVWTFFWKDLSWRGSCMLGCKRQCWKEPNTERL